MIWLASTHSTLHILFVKNEHIEILNRLDIFSSLLFQWAGVAGTEVKIQKLKRKGLLGSWGSSGIVRPVSRNQSGARYKRRWHESKDECGRIHP